jgi:F-type H+-transporting ATPase subunit delta
LPGGVAARLALIQVLLQFQGLASPSGHRFAPGSSRAEHERNVAGENPTVSGVAGRYATALFELALESNAIDSVRSDLAKFQALLGESADLKRLVRSPVFSADVQMKALAAVLKAGGIGGIAANFLRLVAHNRRLFAVSDIIRDFNRLVASHKGEVAAQVTVAEQLSGARLAEVKAALAEVTGKDVVVDVKVDPSIIGGLVVKLGSRMIDTSLRTKLHALKNAMKEVG